jgi:hypothetical protein
MRFTGESLPGIVAVVGIDYEKAGKWSHTTYRLELAPGVRAIAGRDGWETGRFVEGLRDAVHFGRPVDRWIDVANALGVTLAEAQRFLREWRPKAAARLDEVEAALAEMVEAEDAHDGDTEIVAVSFGSPTNRLMAQGFWKWPVVIRLSGQEVGRVVPVGYGDYEAHGRVKILAIERSAGYHGGYVSMRLAVPAGAEAQHGEVE